MKTLRISSIFTLAIIALALLVTAPVAMANTITQYTFLALTPTDFAAVNLSPTVNQFNTGLGTLNSVTITLDVSGAAETSVTENVGDPETFYITEDSLVLLDSPDPSLDTAIGGGSLAEDPSYNSGLIYLTAGQTKDLGIVTLIGTPATESIDPSYFYLFEGAGTLTFDATSLSGYGAYGGGNNQTVNITNNDYGMVTVEYDYSGGPPVIPEPSTLSLFGSGLLGLAGMLRFRFMRSR
ncbi:MAG: PEP-CTERM sorting domain-containing protein [Terracidiphilus sp.]|jgi:hypothetical protein